MTTYTLCFRIYLFLCCQAVCHLIIRFDRKLNTEQRKIEDKEEAVKLTEEKIRFREIEVDRHSNALKDRELDVESKLEFYKNTLSLVEAREAKSLDQVCPLLYVVTCLLCLCISISYNAIER